VTDVPFENFEISEPVEPRLHDLRAASVNSSDKFLDEEPVRDPGCARARAEERAPRSSVRPESACLSGRRTPPLRRHSREHGRPEVFTDG